MENPNLDNKYFLLNSEYDNEIHKKKQTAIHVKNPILEYLNPDKLKNKLLFNKQNTHKILHCNVKSLKRKLYESKAKKVEQTSVSEDIKNLNNHDSNNYPNQFSKSINNHRSSLDSKSGIFTGRTNIKQNFSHDNIINRTTERYQSFETDFYSKVRKPEQNQMSSIQKTINDMASNNKHNYSGVKTKQKKQSSIRQFEFSNDKDVSSAAKLQKKESAINGKKPDNSSKSILLDRFIQAKTDRELYDNFQNRKKIGMSQGLNHDSLSKLYIDLKNKKVANEANYIGELMSLYQTPTNTNRKTNANTGRIIRSGSSLKKMRENVNNSIKPIICERKNSENSFYNLSKNNIKMSPFNHDVQ